ncbi:MAG: hemin uptake protein HemP [Pseudomonadota bacterium]
MTVMDRTAATPPSRRLAEPSQRPHHPPQHRASDLTGGGETALIEHEGQVYTLRITRQGKLILTK